MMQKFEIDLELVRFAKTTVSNIKETTWKHYLLV